MPDHSASPVLIGGVEKRAIEIHAYNPAWSVKFREHAARIVQAFGVAALRIEHIGSTAVPGLAAKPIIDILLVVKDSGNEATYLPALQAAGYVLRVREPDFHEHRMVRTPERDIHVHVFSESCQEIDRYLDFRERLLSDESDCQAYEAVKRRLAKEDWPDMNAYAEAKTEVIEKTLAKARGVESSADFRDSRRF